MTNERLELERTIVKTIRKVEAVMCNINSVLHEVRAIVKQIDTITVQLERSPHAHTKLDNRPAVGCDNHHAHVRNNNICNKFGTVNHNRNACKAVYSSTCNCTCKHCNNCVCNDSNDIMPFSDDNGDRLTYLRIQYNAKYPLWLQGDSWKSRTSLYDMSEVTSGTSSLRTTSDLSWNSEAAISDFSNINDPAICPRRMKRPAESSKIPGFSKCCVDDNDQPMNNEDKQLHPYCGVYEEMMEFQLEYSDGESEDAKSRAGEGTGDSNTALSVTDVNVANDSCTKHDNRVRFKQWYC